MREVSYPIAHKGLANSFTESETPIKYALQFRNRFINAAGGAEKRQGIKQLGDIIAGSPNLTGMHELIKPDGTAVLFSSGNGTIYKFNDTSAWSSVHTLANTDKIRSVQMGKKLIFYNGNDRNQFTEDGSTFAELVALLNAGETASGSGSTTLQDADVTNWADDTLVNINDLVHNQANGAYGIITALASASASHTQIGGTGATGIGIASTAQTSGDRYRIIDLVELNIIPTDGEDDNVATAAASTSATGITASAVSDWTKTDLRVGDYIRNTTRTAVTQVTAISTAAVRCVGVSAQTTGDALIFLKSAMPVTKNAHVHFGRLYMIDERDQNKIRISGPNNPQDMSVGAGTLDGASFSFGDQQPQGDTALAMASYQRFFAVGGAQNIYLFQGSNPIVDVTGDTSDFAIIGLFPQGVKSADSIVNIGNDLVFITPDGVQTASLSSDASTLARSNISEAIKTHIRGEIAEASLEDIQTFHYPKRSWFVAKIGNELYVFNYTAYLGEDIGLAKPEPDIGSWSEFDGKFAEQNAYMVRSNNDLVCCGAGGKVYQFDQGTYNDDGSNISTAYQTTWLTTYEPKARSVRVKEGKYIKPIFDVGSTIPYTIQVEAGFGGEATETITVSAQGGRSIGTAVIGSDAIGGSPITDTKYALRWRGEQARITFTTDDAKGPDTLSRFVLYVNDFGRK